MKVINLGEKNSVLNEYMAQIRDHHVQKDSLRFRQNLQRLGSVFGYEISKTLPYLPEEVVTPMGIAKVPRLRQKLVLATILRAGLPLQQGLLQVFDSAESAFVATYRKYEKDNSFTIQIEYATEPNLEGKILILADMAVATGASIEMTYKKLLRNGGAPLHTHLVCPLCCAQGVDYLSHRWADRNITLWTAAIDEELSAKSYIIPGLGDAGDRAFGEKN